MIAVQVSRNFNGSGAGLPGLEKLVRAVCRRFELRRAVVSITITGDDGIRRLNEKFLERDCATDCLSFDLSDSGANSPKVFELVVNAERAVKEAALRGHSSGAELALYITHGLLHNLGFDDSTPAGAKKMHDTEDEILRQLGYGSVYSS
jgi:probable rRNA maturation factor